MIYVDGSALCQFLPGAPHFREWDRWFVSRINEMTTSQLGLTELRQSAELLPRESRNQAFEVIEIVRATMPLIRFSEQGVGVSSYGAAVLKPFAALHLGAAVADSAINTIATYDAELARVAELYALQVVSPGLPHGWQHDTA